MSVARLVGLTGLIAAAGGCHPNLNSGVSPGREPLASFADVAPTPLTDQPSLTAGHDRTHWERLTVTVPVNNIEHPPAYATWALSEAPPADTEDFPTADSALRHHDTMERPVGEMLLRIAVATGEFVVVPVEMFVTPPASVERSSQEPYQHKPFDIRPRPLSRWYDPVGRAVQLDPLDSAPTPDSAPDG